MLFFHIVIAAVLYLANCTGWFMQTNCNGASWPLIGSQHVRYIVSLTLQDHSKSSVYARLTICTLFRPSSDGMVPNGTVYN